MEEKVEGKRGHGKKKITSWLDNITEHGGAPSISAKKERWTVMNDKQAIQHHM